MKKTIIFSCIFFSINTFSQLKDQIYRTEGHNNSTTYSYFVNTLSLSSDKKYVMTIHGYLSKKLMKKNIINSFTKLRGTFEKKGDTILLIENKEAFLSLNKGKKLMKLIDGKYKSKYCWRKINY